MGSGKMDVGPSGEKIRFLISPRQGQAGVWHAAMSGYSAHSSAYQNSVRHGAGEGYLIWAEYDSYSGMGDVHMVYVESQLKYRKLTTDWDCP